MDILMFLNQELVKDVVERKREIFTYRNVWVPDTTVTIEEKREQTINKILDEY